jgi:cobalt-zinc-cadmium resistance protein CzcA
MGSEFAPNLNEGDFAIQALRIPGTSLTQSVQMQMQIESALKSSSLRSSACLRAPARPRSPPTPCRPISDGYIMLKPREQWPDPARSRDDLLAAVQEAVEKIPGSNYEFSQPIPAALQRADLGRAQRCGRQDLRR